LAHHDNRTRSPAQCIFALQFGKFRIEFAARVRRYRERERATAVVAASRL